MGSITDVLENALLNHICNTAYTPAASLFVALTTADPTDTATTLAGIEVANANGYARTAITFSAAASRQVIQSGAVTFPQATGAWGTITHWAIVTSGTHGAGTTLAHGSFTDAKEPVAGNTPSIPTTEIKVQVSATAGGAGFSDYTVHKWLDLAFRNVAFSKPNTYIGLATATLADTTVSVAGVTEVSGSAYARVQVNPNGGASPTWTNAASGALENVQAITFPTPTGSWGQVTSCFIVDSASGAGNVLGYDNQNLVDQTPTTNDTVTFPAGQFDMSLV